MHYNLDKGETDQKLTFLSRIVGFSEAIMVVTSFSGSIECSLFPFPLSPFQELAIYALSNGHHSLSCVPTGSGKTVPALFAIDHFTKQGKRVFYTSPVKALSNQKYYEFSQKFPTISIGLMTGDIQINPNADVVIMTAEILQNQCLTSSMDEYFENVACIIHDEIHMINDADRGHVWEQLLIQCPLHIQLVLLSATLDSPHAFASWIEQRSTKKVYLGEMNERTVPLDHYGFLTHTSFLQKRLSRNQTDFAQTVTNKLVPISNSKFDFPAYEKLLKMRKIMDDHHYSCNASFCIESVLKHLVEKDMLPAVCFVLSKKQLEYFAESVNVSILPFDSKVPYTIEKECKSILRKKFPNASEFFELPEFQTFVKRVEKGIGIHHSGMVPVLKELTEILFEKGIIRVLFATETFSVGLNMPIRTTIFTNIYKFDGTQYRLLYPHEFTQAAGRAGRRGIDTKGNVIHLLNLYRDHSIRDMDTLLKGIPPLLLSKFKMSYHLFWNEMNVMDLYTKSFHIIQRKDKEDDFLQGIFQEKEHLRGMNEKKLNTPSDVMEEYIHLESAKSSKKLKKNKRHQHLLQEEYPSLIEDLRHQQLIQKKTKEIELLEIKYTEMTQQSIAVMEKIQKKLFKMNYLDEQGITIKGKMASSIHLLPAIPIIENISNISQLDCDDIILLLGSLFPLPIPDDKCQFSCPRTEIFGAVLGSVIDVYESMTSFEQEFYSGETYEYQYEVYPYLREWIQCKNSVECIQLLEKIQKNLGIFTGDFVKLILNIKNAAEEFEVVAEYMGNVPFLYQLKQVPPKLLKYIATNQSLYV